MKGRAVKISQTEDPSVLIDEHQLLQRRLQEVGAVLAARWASRAAVASMIDDLRASILEHFEHEEAGGYFAEALEAAPRLGGRVRQLLSQHPEFSSQLILLRNQALETCSSPAYWERLQEIFADFLQRFRQHEFGENSLLLEAYDVDIGAED